MAKATTDTTWRRFCKVKSAHGDTAFYVVYENGPVRLRLTVRGTWDADDMGIYRRTRGEAYRALEMASPPVIDKDARIAELERTIRDVGAMLDAAYQQAPLKMVEQYGFAAAAICNAVQDLNAVLVSSREAAEKGVGR